MSFSFGLDALKLAICLGDASGHIEACDGTKNVHLMGRRNGSLTENGEENDNDGDLRVDGRHSRVSVVVGARLSVGGAIQCL